MVDIREQPLSVGDKIIYIASDGDRRWGYVTGFTPKMVKVMIGYSKDVLHARPSTVSSDNLIKL